MALRSVTEKHSLVRKDRNDMYVCVTFLKQCILYIRWLVLWVVDIIGLIGVYIFFVLHQQSEIEHYELQNNQHGKQWQDQLKELEVRELR